MALDRPTNDQPDRPQTPSRPDTPSDPHGVDHLTRAEAFASHRYWNEVPRFSAAKDQLAERWPGQRNRESAAPRVHDVSAERRHEAAEKVRGIADGEPPISDAVRAAVEGSPLGGELAGYEHRCKGPDRLMEKVLDGLEAQPDATPGEVIGRIPDAIRFTVCFNTSEYVSGYLDMKDRIESAGFAMYYLKNSWAESEYKGINTRWVTPEGQRFEVQFHTRESFHAKHEVTHLAYERLRGTEATRAERADLSAFQCEVSSWVPLPARVTEIADYRKEGF
ncbi:MAG TPA: hypothetical protein VN847_04735 [Streptosporangiaceae bacterium]|nr:hypothetical protein [Streptosporangiaceae bacterium]